MVAGLHEDFAVADEQFPQPSPAPRQPGPNRAHRQVERCRDLPVLQPFPGIENEQLSLFPAELGQPKENGTAEPRQLIGVVDGLVGADSHSPQIGSPQERPPGSLFAAQPGAEQVGGNAVQPRSDLAPLSVAGPPALERRYEFIRR